MLIKSVKFSEFDSAKYPFNIEAIRNTKELNFNNDTTIFVGENGSGKSTLLKAIAYYNNSINVSKEKMDSVYYNSEKELSNKLKISYSVKTRNGFFFSGEEFITFINNLKEMKDNLETDIKEMREEFKDKSKYVRDLALGTLRSQLKALKTKYDGELGRKSHGEGFLTFFRSRMHKKGIYLFDEPETPLSATNQYQLVVLLTDLVKNGSQVIIATHSPILMALKNAVIYNFNDEKIERINYDDIESVIFTKHFLNNRSNFIDRI